MRFAIPLLAALVVSCGTESSPARAYVPNAGDGTVSVMDRERLLVVDTLRISDGPDASTAHGVAVGAGGTRLFVGDATRGVVRVLDTRDHARIGEIDLGIAVHGIDATPGGDRVVVSGAVLPESAHKRTFVIDAETLEVVGDIDTNLSGHGDCTPDGRYMYLNDIVGHRVVVVDLVDSTIVTEVRVGPEVWDAGVGPNEVAFAPDGRLAYSADYDADSVTVLDTSDPTRPRIVGRYAVAGQPHGITVSPDGSELWISNRGSKDVLVLEAATGTELARIDMAPLSANHVAMTPDGAQVWVTLTADDGAANGSIAVLDAATRRETARMTVGRTPHELSFEDAP